MTFQRTEEKCDENVELSGIDFINVTLKRLDVDSRRRSSAIRS